MEINSSNIIKAYTKACSPFAQTAQYSAVVLAVVLAARVIGECPVHAEGFTEFLFNGMLANKRICTWLQFN